MDRYLRNRIIGGIVVGIVLTLFNQCVRAYPTSNVYNAVGSGGVIPGTNSTANQPSLAAVCGVVLGWHNTYLAPATCTQTTCAVGFTQFNCGGSNIQNAVSITGPVAGCPNGGTKTGSTCTCAAGETDSGTACVAAPNPCASHEIKLGGSGGVPVSCTPKCPEGAHGGARLFPAGVSSACGVKGVQVDYKPDNTTPYKETDGTTDRLLQCRYKLTDKTNICAEEGSGISSCYASNSRIVGGGAAAYCPPTADTASTESQRQPASRPTPTPTDVNTCSVGDKWCANTQGTCASGFSGGEFNGTPICVKNGESVTMQPQPNSSLAPPTGSDRTSPPTSIPSGQTPLQSNEGLTPADRVAVGIGGAVNGPGGAGSGSPGGGTGGGGTTELNTCGLPDTPKCKIDETGTPDGKGAYTEATKALDTIDEAVKKNTDKASETTGKDTSLGVSFGIPSGCSNPSSFSLGSTGQSYQADFCQYQTQVHGFMSMVWYFFTTVGCVGMVRRSISGGA